MSKNIECFLSTIFKLIELQEEFAACLRLSCDLTPALFRRLDIQLSRRWNHGFIFHSCGEIFSVHNDELDRKILAK